jgi:hypothetical protein
MYAHFENNNNNNIIIIIIIMPGVRAVKDTENWMTSLSEGNLTKVFNQTAGPDGIPRKNSWQTHSQSVIFKCLTFNDHHYSCPKEI